MTFGHFSAEIKCGDSQTCCEKRIPIHGDENVVSYSSLRRDKFHCEKRIPIHGDDKIPFLSHFLVDDSYLHVAML